MPVVRFLCHYYFWFSIVFSEWDIYGPIELANSKVELEYIFLYFVKIN